MLFVFGINAGQDTIRNLLNGYTKAITDLPVTKDANTILKLLSTDYTSIDGSGEWSTYSDVKQALEDAIEQFNLGNPVKVSMKISNIGVYSNWGLYEYEVKTGYEGQLLSLEKGITTAIFEKVGGNWVIRHEHSSTTFYEEYE